MRAHAARQQHLLPISTGERREWRPSSGVQTKRLQPWTRCGPLHSAVEQAELPHRPKAGHEDVLVQGRRHQAGPIALGWQVGHAHLQGICGRTELHARATDFDAARARSDIPADDGEQFGCTSIGQSTHADNLSASQLQVHASQLPPGQRLGRQHDFASYHAFALRRTRFAALDDHCLHEFGGRQSIAREDIHRLSVAQDRHVRAQSLNFGKAMRHVNNRQTFVP